MASPARKWKGTWKSWAFAIAPLPDKKSAGLQNLLQGRQEIVISLVVSCLKVFFFGQATRVREAVRPRPSCSLTPALSRVRSTTRKISARLWRCVVEFCFLFLKPQRGEPRNRPWKFPVITGESIDPVVCAVPSSGIGFPERAKTWTPPHQDPANLPGTTRRISRLETRRSPKPGHLRWSFVFAFAFAIPDFCIPPEASANPFPFIRLNSLSGAKQGHCDGTRRNQTKTNSPSWHREVLVSCMPPRLSWGRVGLIR